MLLALIVNELVTNAAKYGINGRGTGQITVSLRRHDGAIELAVEDDGPGFDGRETERRSSGLGLVRGLARQLRGTFAIERAVGARCIVRFPDAHGH
jgi:two-component sensor histidine kinase